jgi:hypothetical protein
MQVREITVKSGILWKIQEGFEKRFIGLLELRPGLSDGIGGPSAVGIRMRT